jgi:lipase
LTVRLNTYSWGHGGGSPIVCVHGVTGHAEQFRKLAQDTLADRRVLAVDLRGHGRSSWLPPWNLETHIGDLAETATGHAVEHATWIGFSLGGRLVAELALHDPRLVERLVLLEPVLHLPPEDGLEAAEQERYEETYATADEAVATLAVAIGLPTPREDLEEEARQHLTAAADGRVRFRYSKSAAVAAWGEMSRPPVPPAGVPTLIVVGTESWVPVEEHLERYRAALGDRLVVERLPSQHWLLWNAFPATADAVRAFV